MRLTFKGFQQLSAVWGGNRTGASATATSRQEPPTGGKLGHPIYASARRQTWHKLKSKLMGPTQPEPTRPASRWEGWRMLSKAEAQSLQHAEEVAEAPCQANIDEIRLLLAGVKYFRDRFVTTVERMGWPDPHQAPLTDDARAWFLEITALYDRLDASLQGAGGRDRTGPESTQANLRVGASITGTGDAQIHRPTSITGVAESHTSRRAIPAIKAEQPRSSAEEELQLNTHAEQLRVRIDKAIEIRESFLSRLETHSDRAPGQRLNMRLDHTRWLHNINVHIARLQRQYFTVYWPCEKLFPNNTLQFLALHAAYIARKATESRYRPLNEHDHAAVHLAGSFIRREIRECRIRLRENGYGASSTGQTTAYLGEMEANLRSFEKQVADSQRRIARNTRTDTKGRRQAPALTNPVNPDNA